MTRTITPALVFVALVAGCASPAIRPGPNAALSAVNPAPARAEPEAAAAPSLDASLDWTRLEAAVTEAGRDHKKRIPAEKLREAALAYALDINRTKPEHLRQYHLDRAAVVLEREVFSGVTLAEGASLRGTVSGGGGGGSRFGSSPVATAMRRRAASLSWYFTVTVDMVSSFFCRTCGVVMDSDLHSLVRPGRFPDDVADCEELQS